MPTKPLAALSALLLGLLVVLPARAGDRATLRVTARVVEACEIRVPDRVWKHSLEDKAREAISHRCRGRGPVRVDFDRPGPPPWAHGRDDRRGPGHGRHDRDDRHDHKGDKDRDRKGDRDHGRKNERGRDREDGRARNDERKGDRDHDRGEQRGHDRDHDRGGRIVRVTITY